MHLPQEERVTTPDFLPEWATPINSVWPIVAASVIISDLLTVVFLAILQQMRYLPVALAMSTVISFAMSNLASRTMFKYHKIVREQNLQLARLNRDIREANKKLTENNAELVAFSHTVAHDLKTPLTGIIGYCQLGMLLADQKPKEELIEYFQRSLTASEQAVGIVDSLLLLASAREENVQFTPLDMSEIVQEAWERQYALTQEHQVTLTIPDEWPVARGYSLWVEGIWSNYLSNAIKYGGRPPVIEVGANVQGDGLIRFWVRDNGDGIPPEEQAKLFTPFNKLRTEQIKGHGLGLSIVQRISERLGGSVGVESELGQGSTFYFTLPANTE
jgi:two-component system sensor histidine kinase/response regulator